MSAIPGIIPCVMIGNALLVICIFCLGGKFKNEKIGLPVSMAIGCVVKALFMGIVISRWLVPAYLPEKMSKMMPVIQTTFSTTQLITAAIGCVLAYVIWIPLKKSFVEK